MKRSRAGAEAIERPAMPDGAGVPRDTGRALKWFAKAAEKGHAGASEIIARLLRSLERRDAPFGTAFGTPGFSGVTSR